MGIDSIDNNSGDDDRRADRKKSESRSVEERKSLERAGRDFKARLETQSKTREATEKQQTEKFVQQSQDNLLSRILETQRKKEEGSKQEQHDLNKKEDDKKDLKKEDGKAAQRKKPDGEVHERIESKQSSSQHQSDDDQEESAGSHGQGFGGSSGGGDGGQKGFSGEQDEGKGNPQFTEAIQDNNWIGKKKRVEKTAFTFGSGSKPRNFLKEEEIGEIVDQVLIATYSDGNKEIEITLKDEIFFGLKLKFSQSPEGTVVQFITPNLTVKSLFILNKVKIFFKLQEKGIKVSKIDVI